MSFIFRMATVTVLSGLVGMPATSSATLMRYDCDTTSGAYSEIVQTQTGPDYALRTDIVAKRLAKHRDWRPGAIIQVQSPEGRNAIGVQMVARSHQAQTLLVSLFTVTDGERKDYNVSTVKLGETVQMSIISKDGVVRAGVAGQIAELPFSIGSGGQVKVSCTTGQFMFEKLEMADAS